MEKKNDWPDKIFNQIREFYSQQNRTVLTSRSQTVDVAQQLGLGDSRVSHQADVYVALKKKSVFGYYTIGKCLCWVLVVSLLYV